MRQTQTVSYRPGDTQKRRKSPLNNPRSNPLNPPKGKRIDLSLSAGAYTRSLRGSASPADAAELLQLVHALFTARWGGEGSLRFP